MNLTFSEKKAIEALIYTGSVELAIQKLQKKRKVVEHHLYKARKKNEIKSAIHLCITYLLHNPSTYIPENLKPIPELPQPIEIIKTDYSSAKFTFDDEPIGINDVMQFEDLRKIHDVPKVTT